MLLTITTTHRPATDLGFLLHKNPARFHSTSIPAGQVHVFYPEATEEVCTAALLLDLDPIDMVRGRRSSQPQMMQQYVNDRPYVASSLISVAIKKAFATALTGRSKERQELVDKLLPFKIRIDVLPCRGGELFLRKLFEPLGYAVSAERHALDEKFSDWGDSRYYTVQLEAEKTLRDVLTHLYVLIPVLDDEKHYWVGDDEVEKLLRHGEGWLAGHPEREQITMRYLKHRRSLARTALLRLTQDEDPDPDESSEQHDQGEAKLEKTISLNEQRIDAVRSALRETGAERVLDLGCGEGKLLRELLKDKQYSTIVGMDVSHRALEIASRRLRLEDLPTKQRERITLLHGSLMYRDKRLEGYDAASCVEVIEHMDPPRLAAFERVVFECAKPKNVIITTPNAKYNVKFETLPAGKFRHEDHRFEWSRSEFQSWAQRIAERFGYTVAFHPIGPVDPELGSPTQMAVFSS